MPTKYDKAEAIRLVRDHAGDCSSHPGGATFGTAGHCRPLTSRINYCWPECTQDQSCDTLMAR